MADAAISSLRAITEIQGADLFVLEQNGEAKKLSGQLLTEFIDRSILDVEVFELSTTSQPTSEYDRITGKLKLGIPKGNSIVSISRSANDKIVYRFADGKTVEFERIKGDTGKSAYDYAVEKGYTGSETDFATLQLNLYNASLNENERVQAEAEREQTYGYMIDRLNEKIDAMDSLVDRSDAKVVNTTLVVTRLGVRVADTTILM